MRRQRFDLRMMVALDRRPGDLLFPWDDYERSLRHGRGGSTLRRGVHWTARSGGRQEDGSELLTAVHHATGTLSRNTLVHTALPTYTRVRSAPGPAGARLEGRSLTADPGEPGVPRTLQDPLAEALRIVDLADARGLLVRLMGGMAIRAHAPDWPARTRRVQVDLDFATRGKDCGAFYELLAAEGYTPDKRHNALFGRKQAYFVDVPRNRPGDCLGRSLAQC